MFHEGQRVRFRCLLPAVSRGTQFPQLNHKFELCGARGIASGRRDASRICAPRKLLTAVQQTRVENRIDRTRKCLKLLLMAQQRSFRTVIQALTLSGGSVQDMLDAVPATDVDFNLVLRMWRRILQARRLLRLPRARSVKTAPLMRMDAFDEVQFKEQFRFSKAEFCVILSNMLDLDGDKLVDDVASSVMIHGAQKDAPCRTIH